MMIAPSWTAFDILQSAPILNSEWPKLPQLVANANPITTPPTGEKPSVRIVTS
jgi:hypothetical protein